MREGERVANDDALDAVDRGRRGDEARLNRGGRYRTKSIPTVDKSKLATGSRGGVVLSPYRITRKIGRPNIWTAERTSRTSPLPSPAARMRPNHE